MLENPQVAGTELPSHCAKECGCQISIEVCLRPGFLQVKLKIKPMRSWLTGVSLEVKGVLSILQGSNLAMVCLTK